MADRPEALVRFVREQHPQLVGSLALYTGDRDLAEELAADTLVRVIEQWDRVRAAASPGAYVHRIAMNLARSRFRRRRARRRALARRGPTAAVQVDPDAGAAVAVRAAVRQLPPRQRACVVLRYFNDLTTDEVALVLEVTPGTVRSNLHSARSRLRDLLGPQVELPPVAPVTERPAGEVHP